MNNTYGFLVSGKLGLEALLSIESKIETSFVCTDKGSTDIINYCEAKGIAVYIGSPKKNEILAFLRPFRTDVILSINYLFLVDYKLINHASKYIINMHGSLLPKYRGRTPHVWAIINNEKETGITAHLINEKCDDGDIVYQEKIKIGNSDTGASILKKYQERYPYILNMLIDHIEHDQIIGIPQISSKATYFGKRTPEDGIIDWNWQKERIKNWVRAQTRPYPGAFCNYKKHKIIVYHIEESDLGFHYSDINGQILLVEDGCLFVKAQNGVLKICDFTCDENVKFVIGDQLNGRY